MSASRTADIAVERDQTPPGEPIGTPATQVLTSAIPTEVLAAYTAAVGVVLAADIGTGYGAFRWAAYGAFIGLAAIFPLSVYRQRVAKTTDKDQKRAVPIPECLMAAFAAAAWGLVMPGGPLSTVLAGNALVFGTAAIALGGAIVLGFATPFLTTGNSKAAPASGTPGQDKATGRAAAADSGITIAGISAAAPRAANSVDIVGLRR